MTEYVPIVTEPVEPWSDEYLTDERGRVLLTERHVAILPDA